MIDITKFKSKINQIKLFEIIGYILLIPPFFGVFSFVKNFVFYPIEKLHYDGYDITSIIWRGYESNTQFPLYFGLMAIAGAFLIKDNKC